MSVMFDSDIRCSLKTLFAFCSQLKRTINLEIVALNLAQGDERQRTTPASIRSL
jgi:hypothetical protein